MAYPISCLKLPKATENRLLEKGIATVEDLAYFIPFRFYDFRKCHTIDELSDGMTCMVKGLVRSKYPGTPSKVLIMDDNGDVMYVSWFGGSYWFSQVMAGETYYFCGQVSFFNGKVYMQNPITFSSSMDLVQGLRPVYHKIKGISEENLVKRVSEAIAFLQANEVFSAQDSSAKEYGLINRYHALRILHTPPDEASYKAAMARISYDKIYEFYSEIKRKNRYKVSLSTSKITSTSKTDDFLASLPFALTSGQASVIETIKTEAQSGRRLHSIVSGDVGCGKTMVALCSALLMWENGLQTAIMAPTLVLAKQHYEEMSSYTKAMGVRLALITSETKKKERTKILTALESGDIDILIGTHSILSPDIEFANLGMTIIDEEHKFGVQQKALMEEYDKAGAHHLTMTATPIPRSYAMTVYCDELAILPITTMPKGRKPIITTQHTDKEEVYDLIHGELAKGHQAYVVCPFIEESSSEQFKSVASVQVTYDEMSKYFLFNYPGTRIDYISGDMKQADILAKIDEFAKHNIDVLISTTIVEVGVNVPNATAIAIMSADRFGLSALHQLRGRVGRKGDQGYCYLVTSKVSDKLDVLCRTTDGFVIAEEDLKLRGPGDITGTSQTGASEVIELILRRPKMSLFIRDKLFPKP